MGTYGQLEIGKLEVLSFKSGLPSFATALFTEGDRREYQREREWWEPEEGEEHQYEWAIEYRCSAAVAKARLEALGYSIGAARRAFEVGLRAYGESDRSLFFDRNSEGQFDYNMGATKQFVDSFTFEKLIGILKRLVKGTAAVSYPSEKNRKSVETQFVTTVDESFFGFFNVDPFHALRAIVEAAPKDDLHLDLTELIENGWVADDVPLCDAKPKFIVLTEGKSDRLILSAALQSRFPHMAPYYSFLDFELGNLGGGTGQLVNLVKALAGAQFSERIIAIFDNDTAAKDALHAIKFELPANIRVFVLPELSFAKKYPTEGPQGKTRSNINGRAVSLELFLGKNNLVDEAGDFLPVIWTSYMPGAKEYQGEIKDKASVQDRFLEALKNPELFEEQDWSAMDQLFQGLFSAFSDTAATGFDEYMY